MRVEVYLCESEKSEKVTTLFTKSGFRDCRFYVLPQAPGVSLPPKAHMLAASSTSMFENIENLSNFDFDP